MQSSVPPLSPVLPKGGLVLWPGVPFQAVGVVVLDKVGPCFNQQTALISLLTETTYVLHFSLAISIPIVREHLP